MLDQAGLGLSDVADRKLIITVLPDLKVIVLTTSTSARFIPPPAIRYPRVNPTLKLSLPS